MITRLFKNWGLPLIIFGAIYFTGYLDKVAAFGQGLILKTGIMNADPEEQVHQKEYFNYSQPLKDEEGNIFTFEKFKGEVLFINMWASWCAPCKAEMPDIQEMFLELQETEDLRFIMLSIDRSPIAAKRYMERYEYVFPYYTWSGGFTDQMRVPSIPTTFVVAKDGEILRKYVGMARYNTKPFKNFLRRQARK